MRNIFNIGLPIYVYSCLCSMICLDHFGLRTDIFICQVISAHHRIKLIVLILKIMRAIKLKLGALF